MSKSIKRPKLTYTMRKSLYGYGFIAIWIVGFICFFARPLITSIMYSLSDIKFLANGIELKFNNFDGYRKAILEDPKLLRQMVNCFTELLYTVPLIIIVSIMIAVLLNKKFVGKTFFRVVFFIPVIISSGVLLQIIRGDNMAEMMVEGSKAGSMLQISDVEVLMSKMNIPTALSDFIVSLANMIFDVLWKSGVQILLFIAGLQTISPSIYEASKIEGASAWENFWKITFPMISPMILLATIYTIIDSFTNSTNVIMQRILTDASYLKYSQASVISVLYFLIAMLFIGVVYFLLNKILPYSGGGK